MFQSTHPRRVRHLFKSQRVRNTRFNPRTHVGCDTLSVKSYSTFRCFNPRTHVGCDTKCLPIRRQNIMFQSTHPRRVRLSSKRVGFKFLSFNPRTHVGCDEHTLKFLYLIGFQSTHPRRVRHLQFTYFTIRQSFNPRTHVGCDVNNKLKIDNNNVSIHAPT